ncbi:hypothetical protein HDU98_007064 [Podochytrium sp. JEL0797]|nr:hypothetical protein HDU98_007064 [Podochytrium sp. JEL0797]
MAAPPGAIGSTDRPVDPILAGLVNSQLVKDAGVDSESRPILVLYSCYLPDPKVSNYDDLLHALILRFNNVAENGYVLVIFSSGSRHRPSMLWILRAYQHLERKYRKNLKRLCIVHPSGWFKLIMQVMGPVISPKFGSKVKWVNTIKDLAEFVPIDQIKVPKLIRDIDAARVPSSNLSSATGANGSNASLISSLTSWAISFTGMGGNANPTTPSGHQFGVPLDHLMGSNGEKGLPRVVKECIGFILLHGLETEGLFRVSPSLQSVNALKTKYNAQEPVIDIEEHGGVHSACGLLKTFFRDLPTPVFEIGMYDTIRMIQTLDPTPDACATQTAFARTVLLPILSQPTYLLLRSLFHLLSMIHANRTTTLMHAGNLAIVWSPNFVKSANPMVDLGMCAVGSGGGGIGTLVKICVERWEEVFGADDSVVGEEGEGDVSGSWPDVTGVRVGYSFDEGREEVPLAFPPSFGGDVLQESFEDLPVLQRGRRGSKSADAVISRSPSSNQSGSVAVVAEEASAEPDVVAAGVPLARMRSRNGARRVGNRHTIVAAEDSAIAKFGQGLSRTALADAASRISTNETMLFGSAKKE